MRNDGILAAFLVLAASSACGGRAESSTNGTSGSSHSSADSPRPPSNVTAGPTDPGETNGNPSGHAATNIYVGGGSQPPTAPQWPGLDAGPDPEPFAAGAPAECSAPATDELPYANEAELDALIIGDWIRCEGTIEPIDGSPAPDGQNGLTFAAYNRPSPEASDQPYLPPGGWLGGRLPPSAVPSKLLAEAGPEVLGVLVYAGRGYSSGAHWWFLADSSGNPGVAFSLDYASLEPSILDHPIFTDGANKMVLFDSIWHGIYVRVP